MPGEHESDRTPEIGARHEVVAHAGDLEVSDGAQLGLDPSTSAVSAKLSDGMSTSSAVSANRSATASASHRRARADEMRSAAELDAVVGLDHRDPHVAGGGVAVELARADEHAGPRRPAAAAKPQASPSGAATHR